MVGSKFIKYVASAPTLSYALLTVLADQASIGDMASSTPSTTEKWKHRADSAKAKFGEMLHATSYRKFTNSFYTFCEFDPDHHHEPSSFRSSSIFHTGYSKTIPLSTAIAQAERLLNCYREECGAPGLVASVAVDGRTVFETGFGYADVEQSVHAQPNTVMRVASISKCMTACMAMYMVERGWLDLDKDIAHYIGSQNYAPKLRDGSTAVVITTRQLLSHMAGIRHYRQIETTTSTDSSETTTVDSANLSKNTAQQRPAAAAVGDAQYPEFFLNKQFKTAAEAVGVFKDDALETPPGEKFLYTTFGYTLLSMVLEKAAEQAGVGRVATADDSDKKKSSSGETKPKENPYSFQHLFQNLIVKRLALFHTYLDVNDKIIPNRARYYLRDQKDHMLKNTPEVDNSCKWAGGGVLSTCGDLVQFGNALLMSHQQSRHAFPLLETFLKPASIDMLWKTVDKTDNIRGTAAYGLGFFITPSDHWLKWYTSQNYSFLGQQSASAYMTNVRTRVVYHSGGAVGASSVLLIVPRAASADDTVINDSNCDISDQRRHPSGVVVALMCNLQGVGLYQQALELCKIFDCVVVHDNNSLEQ